MGCVSTIDFDKFPKQADQDYKYPQLGKRCEVIFHYNTSKSLLGTIVRDDIEEPYETIIKLDDGRYIRGTECQYSILNEGQKINSQKENAIKELMNIGMQIQSIIEQLKENDVAYYSSSEVASIISAIPNLEWGVGNNPKTGRGQFTAYIK